MTNTTTTPEAAIAARQKELDDMLDPIDFPGDWSIRQVDAYNAKRAMLWALIRAAQTANTTVHEVDASLPGETEWQTCLVAARKTLCDELLASSPRARDKSEVGRQQNLTLSIKVVDFRLGMITDTGYHLQTLRLGALMKEAGYVPLPPVPGQLFGELPWYGSLPEVDARIAVLQKRRDEAAAQLAEALLDDEARARLTAEREARVRERNARPQRKTRGDGSQYDGDPDGRRVEVIS